MDIGFQRIEPVPAYPPGLTAASLSVHGWASRARDVLVFKAQLKKQLRESQLGRCCYCRRMLSDPISTHVEHILEKVVYPHFEFETRNLALSCAACNSKKNEAFLRMAGFLSKRATKKMGATVKIYRCQALAECVLPAPSFPVGSGMYRWVHPHFDDYGSHIAVRKGWFFEAKTGKGLRTLRGLQLNALAQLERRALDERLASRAGRLSLLIGALAELNSNQVKDVCDAVVEELRRRKYEARGGK